MSCLAVIDVETTGLNPYRHDRIVEIAAVIMRSDGTILREFVTLLNPERDVGPTSIHGLTTSDILSAPRFAEIAGSLLDVLDGCVTLAGHNVRFDHSFLEVEFQRLGHAFPKGPKLCTLHLAGGGDLSSCCSLYDIDFCGETHAALCDARATALLLATLLSDAPLKRNEISSLPPIVWPKIPKCSVRPLTRDESRRRQAEPPTYLQTLLAKLQNPLSADADDSGVLAYSALLDRVLEDRHVDETEVESLVEVADKWDIDGKQIRQIHQDYLLRLAMAALADGVVTDAERRDLSLVARLLGVEYACLGQVLDKAAERLSDVSKQKQSAVQPVGNVELAGKRVCFTGELYCRFGGQAITREKAAELATGEGITVVETVTKKLDLLVVADPLTQSGKAKKARQYGIRIIHEAVFWKALGVEVE